MDTVIKVEDLSKKYVIGHQEQGSYLTLRDTLANKTRTFGKRLAHPFKASTGQPFGATSSSEEFWALKSISFDIMQGDRVGIIGRNGAGKSTLLKILSRITEPTTGRVTLDGRVASLLEVGTGFHPELTGRENIFLNGAVLGMTKVEIKRKFDEIVAFAEVETFLDTPVKRYSSGMYVRLAFAVAAHLEPEILIIDEVLAVGDTVFQKKCIDKMLEISGQGKTILFVSHNFSAIKALCTNAMLLRKGQLVFAGNVEETIEEYTGESRLTGREIDLSDIERKGTAHDLIFEKITFLNYPVRFGEPIRFKLKLKSTGERRLFPELDFGFSIRDKNQNTVVHCSNRYLNKNITHTSDEDEYLFEIGNIIKPDIYELTFFLREKHVIQDWIINAIRLEIEDGNPYGYHDTKQIQGVILPEFNISIFRDIK